MSIKYEDIARANETIKTMTLTRKNNKTGEIISKEYAEVNQRVKAFRMVHPNGFIRTEIISHDNGIVLMKATVTDDEDRMLATAYAQENQKASAINANAYIENCETSAIGRALGFCGFGIDVAIASADEMKTKTSANAPAEEVKKDNYENVDIEAIREASGMNAQKPSVLSPDLMKPTAETLAKYSKKNIDWLIKDKGYVDETNITMGDLKYLDEKIAIAKKAREKMNGK